ncbi:hypothetical protein Dred_3042 [Desulforamulus reducens MI-1]|uniref:Oligosaccharide repeat unit polymerase n=1 Tax=Desulforamulus reducens (strain ATCC BAA-1160 / DSM 100696 / MI-1) TaxID=349161 RepID=A4J8Z1_DESRM|nr:O-antigen polymerase [Desulforamulus reducens]ABO51544.1 hypothetical protein Dred_3042 [Desulforamulus reducens MI-1]
MSYIAISMCFAIGSFGYIGARKIYSPIVTFSCFFGFLMLFARLQLYGLYSVSDTVYFYIILGVVAFTVGALFANKIKLPCVKLSDKNFSDKYYWIAVVICLAGLIVNYKVILIYFTQGLNIADIYNMMARTVGGEETLLTNTYSHVEEIMQQYIGYPLLYMLVPMSILMYFEKRKSKYLIVAIGLFLIRFLVDFRRTYLVNIIIFVVIIAFIESKKGFNFIKRHKWKFITAIVMLVIAFIVVSRVRRGEDSYSFSYNLYTYYVGSIPYFDQRIQLWQASNSQFTYGFTSFRGIFAPFFSVFGLIFGLSEPAAFSRATDVVHSLHNIVLYITSGHRFNSYATVFFEFYADGGVIGIVIGSWIYGYIAQRLYRKLILQGNVRDKYRYAYFFSTFIMFSVLHFNFMVVCYAWPLIIDRLVFTNKQLNK